MTPFDDAPAPDERRGQPRAAMNARTRLLLTALRLFAERGYAQTSTRDIARGAKVNVAAIAYYFDGKEGLYCAAFEELAIGALIGTDAFTGSGMALRESLEKLFAGMLMPLKQGQLAQRALRILLRELLEPTVLRARHIDPWMQRHHESLAAVLRKQFGSAVPRDDLTRLSTSIFGLAAQVLWMHSAVERINPALLATAGAIDDWALRMADYAEALVLLEQRRHEAS